MVLSKSGSVRYFLRHSEFDHFATVKFWECSLAARLASTSLHHSPSEHADECFLSWFLCQLSCVFVFYSFMPNSCTITHKLRVPRSFHIVLQIIKSKGGFEHFFYKKEWKMPTFDSSNKHTLASNNSPQLDSCLPSSKVCLLKYKRICFKKKVSPKSDKTAQTQENQPGTSSQWLE
jgi:hypothetical protein